MSLPRLFRDETYVVFLYILFDLGFQLGSCDGRKIGFSWFSAWRKGVNMSTPVMADSGNLACCRNVRSPLMGVARRNNSNNIGTFLFFSSIPMAVSTRSISRSSSRQDIKLAKHSSGQSSKPADYVYFDRTTTGFSDDAAPRAKAAQLKLEHYYKVAVDAAIERNTRFSPLARLASVATDNYLQGASNSRGGCRPTQ